MGQNESLNSHSGLPLKGPALGFDPATSHSAEADLVSGSLRPSSRSDNPLAGWESAWIDLGGEG
jgi:hypothetical protein